MDSSTENKEKKSLHYLRELLGKLRESPGKLTIKMRGEFADAKERRHYRETLRRRRTRLVCLKLLANALFLFAWAFVNLNDHMYNFATILLVGGNFWVDFSVYAGISGCFPLFCFLGLLRERTPVSQVWFEVVWLFGVFGFDGVLIFRQTACLLEFTDWGGFDNDNPYITASAVLYGLTVTGLAIDLLLSLLWSGFLGATARLNKIKYPRIWVSHAQNFPWLSDEGSTGDIPQPHWRQLILGAAIKPSPTKSIPEGITYWITNSTMFRRIGTEPLSHSLLRGGLAVILWVIILAYGILNCAIYPILQFTVPQGLPTRYLTKDSRVTSTFGSISGFIVLDVVPMTQIPVVEAYEIVQDAMCDSIDSGIQANVKNPSTGQVTNCQSECNIYPLGAQTVEFLQIEASWSCDSIWDVSGFRISESVPDLRPHVSVVWNSSAFQPRRVLNAGVSTVSISSWDDYAYVQTNGNSPRDWVPGVTFNFTAGQTLRVDVGRRRIYANRATFLDLIGIAQSPDVFVTYPILSAVQVAPSTTPELTTLNFYPGFGAYNDELYEEYLDNTVLSGLSATGGLYSAFDVIYILIFGRSLLAALFGGKPIAPFGALASMVQRDLFCKGLLKQYDGILGDDPKKKAEATCEFLHDFILDLKPLEPPKEPSDDSEKPNARSDVINNENDIESAGGIMPNLLYAHANTAGGSARMT